ncbi:MAG: hypothetical protein JRI71_03355 [Deltaproteobacteria bacterium]|nr:hypothetical protein [Deltaproteobacteria bacterium]
MTQPRGPVERAIFIQHHPRVDVIQAGVHAVAVTIQIIWILLSGDNGDAAAVAGDGCTDRDAAGELQTPYGDIVVAPELQYMLPGLIVIFIVRNQQDVVSLGGERHTAHAPVVVIGAIGKRIRAAVPGPLGCRLVALKIQHLAEERCALEQEDTAAIDM